MSGNVAQEGMTYDLDWLSRMGIGGIHAFSGALFEPTVVAKPLPFMSPGWREAFRYAVNRAKTLGMDVTIAGSPGWSETGGPWVAPEQGMKKYVWSETQVEGARPINVVLAALPQASGSIQSAPPKSSKLKPLPTASGTGPVIAFPVTAGQNAAAPTFTLGGGEPISGLADAPLDLSASIPVALSPDGRTRIIVDFGRTMTLRGLTIAMDALLPFDVEASLDGKAFVPVGSFGVPEGEAPSPQQTVAFAPTAARVMRVTLRRPQPAKSFAGLPPSSPGRTAKLRLLRFSELPRIARFETKAGFEPSVAEDADVRLSSAADAALSGIDPARVIDLTAKVSAEGRLSWTPPPGHWRVLRFGWTLTGRANAPAEPEATGLEVDKLDRAAVQNYIDTYLQRYEQDVGVPLGSTGISGLLTDSWEAGVQNWTPAMMADFRRLRGYDLLPWLPALAGYVVKDHAASDAVLADFRRTLKDLVVSNHYDVLAATARRRGMTYYTEVNGDLPRAISDGLTAKGRSDIPTAEFWYRAFTTDPGQPPLVADLKEASSAAHLYGRKLAAAEALTMAALTDPWSTAPGMLKPVADRIFALGINRILIHDSHHQPFVDRKPGLQLAVHGQWFNRNETWAEQARPWTDYLARTSYLLQQGRYVADVAFLYGEERSLTEIYNHAFNTAVPPGYGFDYMDAPTLASSLTVEQGAVATPSGMRYRVLYLGAESGRLTLAYVRRLRDLVRQGAVLVGTRPAGQLGLEGAPEDFLAVVDELWPKGAPAEGQVGSGRLLRTNDLGGALKSLGVAPDADIDAKAEVLTLHRRTEDADLFYVSNQSREAVNTTARFRISGKVPEWWSPEDGQVRPLAFRPTGDQTAVDLQLLPEQAGFVVFRNGPSPMKAPEPVAVLATYPVAGAWNVAFEPGRGAPAAARFDQLHDWVTDPDPGIRYFSGRATYSQSLKVARARTGERLILDIGQVHELVTVTLNGKDVATAWHAPYRVDVTKFVKPGVNKLELTVTNVWANRLIGDKQPGATPVAFAPQSTYKATSPLRPSGLIGPVKLVRETGQAFAF